MSAPQIEDHGGVPALWVCCVVSQSLLDAPVLFVRATLPFLLLQHIVSLQPRVAAAESQLKTRVNPLVSVT
jgi:hypothetical protein